MPTADHFVGPGTPPAPQLYEPGAPATDVSVGTGRGTWSRQRVPAVAALAAVVVTGLALRIWVLSSNLGPVDSDEAVGGLIARHFLDGEGSVFLWGNNYGGTLEAIATAPLFALFGSGPVLLKVVPIVAFAAACVLTWRIGLRTVGPDAARVGAALLWVASGPVVLLSTKARLYYGASLVLACAALLLCLRLADRPARRDVALLGLVLGLGLWTAPFVFYVALPAVVWLLATRPRLILELPWGLPAALLGSAPWLSYNLRTGWNGLTERDDPIPFPTSYGIRLRDFPTELVPQLLGFRKYSVPGYPAGPWTPGPASKFVFLGLVAGVVVLVAACLWRRRCALVPLVVVAVGYPFVFAVPKASWYLGEPRYGLFLAPVLALLFASGITVTLRHPAARAAAVAAAALLSVASLQAMMDFGERNPGHHDQTPPRMGALAAVLEREGVRTVVADYWIAYALTFHTRERIIATPTATPRYRPYQERVAREGARTYVFFRTQADADPLVAAARADGIGYRTLQVDQFNVVLFDRPVGHPPAPG